MTNSDIAHWHERLGAQPGALNGVPTVLTYGEASAEYAALRKTAGIIDLSFRGRVCLTGADRARFLHGQVTNDVNKLKPGQGCYAALVNASGKIESDLNIYNLENELLLDFEPGLTPALLERFEKFIIADDVQAIDVSADYGLLSIQGPQSEAVLGKTRLGINPPAEMLSVASLTDANYGEIYCTRNSRGPAIGFDLFVPVAALVAVADRLVSAAGEIGGRPVGWDAIETARIEAGLPRFGQDMEPANLASETGIENRAISYTKGCYIGQEVISRIRAYGRVAKGLRGLQFDGGVAQLPQKGDKIFAGEKEAGYVTSAVHSPTLHRTIALGYVRREHNEIETELLVDAGGERIAARIVALPFVRE